MNCLLDGEAYGNDYVEGGAGNDEIFGDPPHVVVDHLYNSDNLSGDVGNDCVVGVAGMDTFYGGNGNDHLSGGALLYGEGGNDRLTLTYCSPFIAREGGIEYIDERVSLPRNVEGGLGNDRLLGSVCEESLNGDEGNDFLYEAVGTEPSHFESDEVFGGEGEDIAVAHDMSQIRDVETSYFEWDCPAGEPFCDISFYTPRACLEPVW